MSKMNVEKTDLKEQVDKKQFHMPRILIVYDMLVYLIAAITMKKDITIYHYVWNS